MRLLGDYTFQIVALGSAVLGAISGMVGSYAVLQRQSLLGDAVSHSALAGIALVFLMTGTKVSEHLLVGALAAGVAATLLVLLITRFSRVKFDSALALVMSSFFGLGMVLLTHIQKLPNSNQAGLSRFLFGQASTLLKSDVRTMLIVGAVLLVVTLLFWKEFKLVTFDGAYAKTMGLPVGMIRLLLSAMIVGGIIMGLQTVGIVLMSSMLIAPAVAARQWTNKLGVMVGLSSFFGALAGVLGTLASSLWPKTPTGPATVVVISAIALLSILFAPGRGMVFRQYKRRQHQRALKAGILHEEGM